MMERISGMPNEEYHKHPAISRSQLIAAVKSYSHYNYARNYSTKVTEAMNFGSAYHSQILTPDLNEVIVAPNVDRRTKAGKEEYADFEAKSKGKIIISYEESAILEMMHYELKCHPESNRLLFNEPGENEVSFFFSDSKTGLQCRVRTDRILNDGTIIDLKSCQDASPVEFAKTIANSLYHVQGAYYMDGAQGNSFVFIAQEKKPPYKVGVYRLDEYAIEKGRDIYRRGLDVIRYFEDHPWEYSGYTPEIEDISLPAWA